MSENSEKKTASTMVEEEQYSLNDDRRVKVLSPGAMVAKRFIRNRIAVMGLAILTFMFLFSFVGGSKRGSRIVDLLTQFNLGDHLLDNNLCQNYEDLSKISNILIQSL